MKLNAVHKILLNTDGSITTIIEAITGKKVELETVEQRIVKADEDIAKVLKIDRGDDVNYRVVNLKVDGVVYVRAISYTPIKRLIMRKHKIEARREIRWKRIAKADKNLAKDLEINEGSTVLIRNYDIIHKGEVLINITEIFPAERYTL